MRTCYVTENKGMGMMVSVEEAALIAARKHNQEYMMALKHVVDSLYLVSRSFVTISNETNDSSRSSSSSSSSRLEKEQYRHDNINISMDENRWQTSMAIIMTSISASWLYMHFITTTKKNNDDDDDDNSHQSEEYTNKRSSMLLLQEGICLAACCLMGQTNPKSCHMTWIEGLYILDLAVQSSHADANANANANANATTLVSCSTKDRVCTTKTMKQQMGVVLRQLYHSLQVVGLISDPSCPYDNDDMEMHSVSIGYTQDATFNNPPKRRKKCDEKIIMSQCNIQEYLVEALYHHRQGTHDSKQKQKQCIQKAMDVEKGGIALKFKTVLEAMDFLENGELLDGKSTMKDGLDFMMESLIALSKTSRCILCLLGCVYAQQRDFNKAMECFERLLVLLQEDDMDHVVVDVEERDIVWNIAECFRQKGRMDLVLESLLYWIHLLEKDVNCHLDHPTIKPAVFPITTTATTTTTTTTTNNKVVSNKGQESKRWSVLYRIFFAASWVKDWSTCRVALDDLMQMSMDDFLIVAKLYVMIEQNVHPPPFHHVKEESILQEGLDPLLEIGQLLYESEIILHHFLYPSKNEEISFDTSGIIMDHATQELSLSALKKMEKAQALWKNHKKHLPESTQRQIQSVMDNNLGIALVYNGRVLEAMPMFFSALKASQEDEYALFPLFNLSLLLWIQGFKKEACKLYLTKRGYKENLEKAVQGQTRYLELDLEKSLIDLEHAKTKENDKNTNNGNNMFLLLDICMMKYILKKK